MFHDYVMLSVYVMIFTDIIKPFLTQMFLTQTCRIRACTKQAIIE